MDKNITEFPKPKTIKVWFTSTHISRSIPLVKRLERLDNELVITDVKGKQILVNFNNVTLIETE